MQNENSSANEIIKEVKREGKAIVLVLAGEIDMKCSANLRSKFMELISDKPPLLVVNMEQVGFMDSSGLGTLVELLKWTRRNEGKLRLVGLTQGVRNIFEISRLESVFEICETEAEALS